MAQYGEVEFAGLGVELGSGLRLFRPVGCRRCGGTGYRGRMAVHELLDASDAVKRMILKGGNVIDIREEARRGGMTTLMQDGIEKVLAGHTDMAQVRAVCTK
jgi:type II secretory ATPase GspE/PulE/Tfp pilus assembly ATPase PilB-like protein